MIRPVLLLLGALSLITACGAQGGRANAQDLGLTLTQPIVVPPPQTAQQLRAGIGPGNPASLLVIGDSLAQGFGAMLIQQADARGLPIDVTNRGRVSTGLARADYYDWPEAFEAMAESLQPDIVVAHFGSNDMQTILAPEGRTAYGGEDWEEGYRTQIRKILNVAAEHDIVLYWIGPGPDGNRNLDRHLARANPLYEDEAEAAGAVYFPLIPLTTGPEGTFARTVQIDGAPFAMRTADGSHFTGAGYRFVADRIFDALIERFPALGPAVGSAVGASAGDIFAMALQ